MGRGGVLGGSDQTLGRLGSRPEPAARNQSPAAAPPWMREWRTIGAALSVTSTHRPEAEEM